ncbi:hypothetical protein PV416_37615, partial [Streptomyces ipomoeae]|uniref:hypothetical protein n=1 Tax=Streptomyces ipomoeae TaxID=103232 RepID=UPI0029A3BCEC
MPPHLHRQPQQTPPQNRRRAASGGIGERLSALDVVSFGESAEADEAAGNGGEGQEVLGLAFVA